MTVGRRHVFALDDAALSGGAAIAAAGSGLPRRITGAVDFGARVLALGPSGFWRLNEVAGQFLDRTANARHLTYSGTGVRGVAGHGRGGDTGLAVRKTATAGHAAAAEYPEHRLSSADFAAIGFMRGWNASSALNQVLFLNTQASPLTTQRGYCFGIVISGTYPQLMLHAANGTVSGRSFVYDNAITYGAVGDREWHAYGVRVTGGVVRFMVDGVWLAASTLAWVDPAGAGSAALVVGHYSSIDVQDVAVWGGVAVPSEAQMTDLANVALGRARFSRAFTADATVRGLLLPGGLNREKDAAAEARDTKAYLSTDGVTRTEIALGADPAFPVTAGQTLYLDVEPTHLTGRKLPFLADPLGGGPTLFYEEADPPPSFIVEPRAALAEGTASVSAAAGVAGIARPFRDVVVRRF